MMVRGGCSWVLAVWFADTPPKELDVRSTGMAFNTAGILIKCCKYVGYRMASRWTHQSGEEESVVVLRVRLISWV
jgi:hypothetical protein